ETGGFIGDGGCLLSVDGDRMGGDLLQRGGDVHLRQAWNLESLPIGTGAGPILAGGAQWKSLLRGHEFSLPENKAALPGRALVQGGNYSKKLPQQPCRYGRCGSFHGMIIPRMPR